jgi:DNA-binding SARP family transcriptional activator/tetratricopeptide (TPR) repeat protein
VRAPAPLASGDRVAEGSGELLRVRLLGGLDLHHGERCLGPISSARARSLIGYLVLHAGAAQTRQHLAFLLWPDSSEDQARTNLRNVLHALRHGVPELGDHLEITPSTLRWAPTGACWVDIEELDLALADAAREDRSVDERITSLRRATDLYGGDLLDGCYDDWLLPERERRRDRHLAALRQLADELLAQGRPAEAVVAARELIRREPLDEPAHRLLMAIHVAAGDRAGAVRAYHECVAVLERELGVEPAPATQAAHAALVESPEVAPVASGPRHTAAAGSLVGREHEWARLVRSWQEAEGASAHLVLVTGEPGIGKTRLVEELVTWCSQRGAVVGRARCYAAEGDLGHGALIAWLRTSGLAGELARSSSPERAELAVLLPELDDTSLAHPVGEGIDRRQRLLDAATSTLTSTGRPILLVLDDAQWADALSLQLVHYLVRGEEPRPLLVVATARREDLDGHHPLTTIANGLAVTDRLVEVPLTRLLPSGTARLASQLLGTDLDEAATRGLHIDTEGNPLFIVESVRAGFGSTVDDGTSGMPISPKLRAVIGARLAQLSEPSRQLLQLAATVGRAFSVDLLAQASTMDELTLARCLDELWRRGLIREHGIDGYDFSHGRIRDVALDEQGPVARRQNHLRVAEALRSRHAGAPARVSGRVAAAYEGAGRADDAITWYLSAALEAQRRYADIEAIRLLERALRLSADLPEDQRPHRELQVLSALPTALVGVEGFASDRLLAVQQRAAEVASDLEVELDPPVLRSLVMSALCRDDLDGAASLAARLHRAAATSHDEGFEIEGEYLLGIAAFWSGRLDDARRRFESVIERFDPAMAADHIVRFGHQPAIVCRSRLANTLWFLGRPDLAREARDRALDDAHALGHPYTRWVTGIFAGLLALDLEDHGPIARHVQDLEGARNRSEVYELNAIAFGAFLDVLDGRASEGIASIRGVIERCGDRNPAPSFRSTILRLLVAAHDVSGDAAGALAATDEALRLGGTPIWQPEVRRVRAEALAALGRPAVEISAELELGEDVARAQGSRGPLGRLELSRARLLGR